MRKCDRCGQAWLWSDVESKTFVCIDCLNKEVLPKPNLNGQPMRPRGNSDSKNR